MIISRTNSKIKFVRRLQAERRFRQQEQAFVVEGTRWVQELWVHQALVQWLFFTESWQQSADHALILQQVEPVLQTSPLLVSDEVMREMSDMETAPGVLAVVAQRPLPIPPAPHFLLILDGINNPGNLGTMLRTASAAGVDAVILAPGCVDATNPKVVRGSMGALLRLPIHTAVWGEIQQQVQGMPVWVATIDGSTSYSTVNWRQPSALIIGSEASGASPDARQTATGSVTIPMHSATESLNAAVAAAVLLFEAKRQREG